MPAPKDTAEGDTMPLRRVKKRPAPARPLPRFTANSPASQGLPVPAKELPPIILNTPEQRQARITELFASVQNLATATIVIRSTDPNATDSLCSLKPAKDQIAYGYLDDPEVVQARAEQKELALAKQGENEQPHERGRTRVKRGSVHTGGAWRKSGSIRRHMEHGKYADGGVGPSKLNVSAETDGAGDESVDDKKDDDDDDIELIRDEVEEDEKDEDTYSGEDDSDFERFVKANRAAKK